MNNISLRKIDESNFLDCFQLKLAPGQEAYVSHPIRSLAQAYVYYNQCTPFGIYAGDKMVGYVMVIYDYDEETYNIWHMMIDSAFQGKGYGRAALQEVLNYIAAKPFGSSGHRSADLQSTKRGGRRLYRQIGFAETGRSDDDEVELGLTLSNIR